MPIIEGFTMPSSLEVDQATATPNYARFIAEPWEKGFGHTLGNALRRVLLSSMDGAAISSIRIEGVAHEFTHIPDVVEDVTEIVLNMKKVKLQCAGEFPRTLELYAEKAGKVTASDIREDGVTTVLNPDLVICTLDRDRPLRMEIEIDFGRGYRPAEENKREDHPIGVIPVDCLFSPVTRVRYDVQACRVGQRTDYDRLDVEVWTDGRIDPQEAVARSAALLQEHLAVFCTSKPEETPTIEITNEEDQELLERLSTSVNGLELSVRAVNCLNTAQIRTIGQLVQKNEPEMLKYRNFGKKSLQEIKEKLLELDLALGMTLKDELVAALDQRLNDDEDKD
ncbi:MAG: DNA-directed RNA polymerase subunit alpha [Lentisphaerae bacterium]|jgi:DNA-directed RNA polymerase subunit alpha|nr:DNA-directed RNA polymerase subunit alpha [Lentisphaerota bacterium]MBT4823020.1 DNA-directed RNA polymerase subunit alpha [Lentisphaerota bacterium]MBT5608270.1 DNA-directed RNA polymerase subunit alpha [Lentisphaerota bacterium]MBT7061830.1 DNA-directed RNA polymerase subunit alpha [Lentisphaerota bacterium]MBT7846139.1 DNA-directed RNA polymerase subunit alpha [Lentisphaerota bacterium]